MVPKNVIYCCDSQFLNIPMCVSGFVAASFCKGHWQMPRIMELKWESLEGCLFSCSNSV